MASDASFPFRDGIDGEHVWPITSRDHKRVAIKIPPNTGVIGAADRAGSNQESSPSAPFRV